MTVETAETEMTKSDVTDVDLADVDFTISTRQKREIERALADFRKHYQEEFHTSEKQQLALVVGRFQPPHLGHLVKLLMAAEIAEVVAVGVGSANADIHDERGSTRDVDNPFSAEDREFILKHLLKKFLPEEEIQKRFRFVPLDDYYHRKDLTEDPDIVWGNETTSKVLDTVSDLGIRQINSVLGDKQGWVSNIFATRGVLVISHPLFDMENQVGTEIRKRMRKPRRNRWGIKKKPILSQSGPHNLRRS